MKPTHILMPIEWLDKQKLYVNNAIDGKPHNSSAYNRYKGILDFISAIEIENKLLDLSGDGKAARIALILETIKSNP